MKHIYYKIIPMLLLFFTVASWGQSNSITFTPINQSVTVNSGEEIEVNMRLNCYGAQPGASSWFINTNQIPDGGYQIHSPGTGVMYVGDVTNVTFRFNRTVSTTTTSTYRFRYDWTDQIGNQHNGYINITVTYSFNDPDTDGDGIPDSQDNCPTQAGPASNNGCPETCSLSPPSTLTTSNITYNSATLSWSFVTGNNGYQLEYKKASASTWSTHIDLGYNITSNNLNNLQDETTYQWRIRTQCDNGSFSDWSTVVNFTTPKECIENLTITDLINDNSPILNEVSNTITSYSRIENNAKVTYSAGKKILLKTGYGNNGNLSFHAKAGSIFIAKIEGCSNETSREFTIETMYEDKQKTVNNFDEIINYDSIYNEEPIKEIVEFVKLHPNPTSSNLNIESNTSISSWMLLNPFGRQLKGNTNINSKKADLNLSGLTTGIYFLKIQLDSGNTIIKRVIKK